MEPVEFGWTNVANYSDYASRDMTLRADAGRYECWNAKYNRLLWFTSGNRIFT